MDEKKKYDINDMLFNNIDYLLEESEKRMDEELQDPNSEASIKLKKRVEQDKIRNKNLHCIKCGNEDLKLIKEFEVDGFKLWARYKCKKCGKKWDEADPGLL